MIGFTRTVLTPSSCKALRACDPEYSNSPDCPILRAPAPSTSTLPGFCMLLTSYLLEKVVEEPLGIHGTRRSFRMELDGEEGQLGMAHTFITPIIGMDEPGFEI